MAKVLLGAGIVEVTGKIGGTVFQRGKAGTIMRRKVIPRKGSRNILYAAEGLSYSSAQRARQSITYLQRAWKDLTFEQRKSWNDQATGSLSGLNMFVHRNMKAGGLTVSFPSFEPVPIQFTRIVLAETYWYPPLGVYVLHAVEAGGIGTQASINIYTNRAHSIGNNSVNSFTLTNKQFLSQVDNLLALFPTGKDPGNLGAIDAQIAIVDTAHAYEFERIPAYFKGDYPNA